MQPKGTGGIRRLINAAVYSAIGIRAAWRNEAAFRQEAVSVIALIPIACWLGTSMMQRALLVFSILVILITELLNSAIEAVVDRIGADYHPLSGQAKNMGSAAVMFSLIAAGAVWGMIIWQRWA
jgi:diacylglycerol kinase (ATP)